MIRKTILVILFTFIMISSITLYLVKTIDVDELNLFYSVKEDDLYIYSSDNDLIGKYTCETEDCTLASSFSETVLDNVIITDEVKKQIDMTIPVMEDFAFISEEGYVALVNLENNESINNFEAVKYLNNNFIVLKNESNMYALAYFNSEGLTFITEYIYNYIGQSDYSENFLVMINDEYFLINQEGNVISSFFSDIFNYTNDEIIVKENGYYYIYNYKNEKLFTDGYTMVKLDDNYIYTVTNNLLDIYDKTYEKINEESINLGIVVNWISYYVYNDDHKFLYESSVFTKEYENNILTIFANNEVYELYID